MVTRPVRERSLEKIDQLMEETLENTGLDAVSLISLSTCDFSRPRKLVEQASNRAHSDHVSLSLPSLRLAWLPASAWLAATSATFGCWISSASISAG